MNPDFFVCTNQRNTADFSLIPRACVMNRVGADDPPYQVSIRYYHGLLLHLLSHHGS